MLNLYFNSLLNKSAGILCPFAKKNVVENFLSDKKSSIFASDCVRKP